MNTRNFGWIATWTLSAALLLPAVTPSARAEEKKPRLAGIVFQEDQFFRLIQYGMRDAAAKAGVELLQANSNNKPDKEIELVSTYVSRKVDAIVISPLSKKASVAALSQADKKGIKVVTFNTSLDADFVVSDIGCSAANLGQQSGAAAREYIEKNLGGKANVAIVAFKSQAPEQSDGRTGGFKGEITKLPSVTVVAEQDAWLSEMAVKKVGDILTAHPEVNVIFAANEGGTAGAALAVKNAGKAGKVAVFGVDVSEQLLTMLQSDDNILQAVTGQRPVEIGRMAVENALKSLKGEKVEKVVQLPGVLLSRKDPQGVKDYQTQFKKWTSGR
jgi:simple sugar transport system substrate-binding protein/ribose transport system substrate-binding protein